MYQTRLYFLFLGDSNTSAIDICTNKIVRMIININEDVFSLCREIINYDTVT